MITIQLTEEQHGYLLLQMEQQKKQLVRLRTELSKSVNNNHEAYRISQSLKDADKAIIAGYNAAIYEISDLIIALTIEAVHE